MHANVLIAIGLVLTVGAAPAIGEVQKTNHPPKTATAVPEQTAHWSSVPEDTSPWRREPFKRQESETRGGPKAPSLRQGTVADIPEINLQGILKSNRNFYAIINGMTIKTGDRIDGWTVSGITRHSVTVRRDKEQHVYDIFQGRIDRGSR
jgi:hypothetical protein